MKAQKARSATPTPYIGRIATGEVADTPSKAPGRAAGAAGGPKRGLVGWKAPAATMSAADPKTLCA